MLLFQIGRTLGIDDPVGWADSLPPKVLDRWIAFRIFENEQQNNDGTEQVPMNVAHNHLTTHIR